jgi:hypothetical protein
MHDDVIAKAMFSFFLTTASSRRYHQLNNLTCSSDLASTTVLVLWLSDTRG